jgi:hypothetical protein
MAELELEEFLHVFELSSLSEAADMLELLEKYMAIGSPDEIRDIFLQVRKMVPVMLEYQVLGTPESIKETLDQISRLTEANSKRLAERL